MKKLINTIIALAVLTVSWFIQPSHSMAADPERVTVEQLKSMLDNKADVIVVDTRNQSSFKAGHIPGAISMDYPDEIRAGVAKLPRDKTIIFY